MLIVTGTRVFSIEQHLNPYGTTGIELCTYFATLFDCRKIATHINYLEPGPEIIRIFMTSSFAAEHRIRLAVMISISCAITMTSWL